MELWLMDHGEWLFFGFLLLSFAFLLLQQYVHNRSPEYSADATVDSHRAESARFHSRWSSGWNHLITFRLSDGDALTLYTTEQEFYELKDGMSVTIVWQHENLLRYEIR